jgi:hypothetical protein
MREEAKNNPRRRELRGFGPLANYADRATERGEGNSNTNSPDVGSDISSDMKHRTVDGSDGS